MAQRIKKGDTVVVISGNDGPQKGKPGKSGKVLGFTSNGERVLVEGVNRVWKHVKPSQRYPQGGRIQKDAPVHVSNVMIVDPQAAAGKPVGTRVRFEVRDGVKHRVAVRSGADLGAVGITSAPAKA